MLAIARILRTGARMLLLDEPTEGLAPVIVQQIGRTIREIKKRGFTVLLVEQNFRFAATVADRHYVMEHGKIVDMIPNSDLESQHGQAARVSRRLTPQTTRNGRRPMKLSRRALLGTAAAVAPLLGRARPDLDGPDLDRPDPDAEDRRA